MQPDSLVPTDSGDHGLVDLNHLEQALTPATSVVSLMWANNEIGSISPVSAIARICRDKGVWLHSDATQAVGKIPVNPSASGVDLLSFSGHKIYGPPGIGVLIVRRERGPIPIQPLIEGGRQQGGLRSGTLPLPLIVGLTEALSICEQLRETEAAHLAARRDQLWGELSAAIPGLVRHTPIDSRHPTLPHNLCIGIPGIDGDVLLARLRESDLCVSSGAACSSSHREPSHVLTAIGVAGPLARSSLRFGLGRGTTSDDVSRAVHILAEITR